MDPVSCIGFDTRRRGDERGGLCRNPGSLKRDAFDAAYLFARPKQFDEHPGMPR